MNREEYAAWVQAAWIKEAMKNMPVAKAARQLKAGRVESRKAWASARRSLAAKHGAKMRSLRKQQAENGEAIRKRREASDREFEQRRWDLLIGSR